jgi:hypothetical protein
LFANCPIVNPMSYAYQNRWKPQDTTNRLRDYLPQQIER